MLADPDMRSKIRKLPAVHLYFPMKELDGDEIVQLLPQITESQWSGILDLDLWSRDDINLDRFLGLIQPILYCEDAVARKLLRGTDPELWQLLFRRNLQVFPRLEEDEFDETDTKTDVTFPTPDGNYLISLPGDAEKARLLRLLILRLYELAPEWVQTLIHASQFATSLELEENLYSSRKRRIEEMGFLDYFDALEIYTPIDPGAPLPKKIDPPRPELSQLPSHLPKWDPEGPLFLFRILAHLSQSEDLTPLIEDLFFLCNKLLSADQTSPDDPGAVKRTLRKALTGASLGLEVWSDGNPIRGAAGLSRHFSQSFFQIGYQTIRDLRTETLAEADELRPEPGSYLEAILEGLTASYPVLVEQNEGGWVDRFFETRADLEWARKLREQMKRVRE